MRNSKNLDEVKELDVTSFMNLMVVLVPILLLGMSMANYQTISMGLGGGGDLNEQSKIVSLKDNSSFSIEVLGGELSLIDDKARVFYTTDDLDFSGLNRFLYFMKLDLLKEGKNVSVTLNLPFDYSYQHTLELLQATSVYHALDAGQLVELELFSSVSFGEPKLLGE